MERLVEELQPFAVPPLSDPTQPLLTSHHTWLLTPQLLSHTLTSAPAYLDDPVSPILLLTPPSSFTSLLTTAVDHTSPPSLTESLAPGPVIALNGLQLPITPLLGVAGGGVRCVGYRWVERRLGMGEEVLAIGRVVRGEGGGLVMKGAGGEGEGVRVERGTGDCGKRVARESRESEWGMELMAAVGAVVGVTSAVWWWYQRSEQLRRVQAAAVLIHR